MEEESTSDSLSIQSRNLLLEDSQPKEIFTQNELSFDCSQLLTFPLSSSSFQQQLTYPNIANQQDKINDRIEISSNQFGIGNLPLSNSQWSPVVLQPPLSNQLVRQQQSQLTSTQYKTTIDMLEDLDSQLPDYSTIKRSKYENMSQVANYHSTNNQITPVPVRLGQSSSKPVEASKELISSTLRKLPWLNLSVNTISQNLSQHEVKMLLRYKNIDVNSGFGVTIKKTAMCETLLRVLREDQFKEEMRLINAPVIPSAVSVPVSLVGELAVERVS